MNWPVRTGGRDHPAVGVSDALGDCFARACPSDCRGCETGRVQASLLLVFLPLKAFLCVWTSECISHVVLSGSGLLAHSENELEKTDKC